MNKIVGPRVDILLAATKISRRTREIISRDEKVFRATGNKWIKRTL